jgi:anti-anti-sigma factor
VAINDGFGVEVESPNGGPFGWAGHLALAFDDESQRSAGVAGWARDGLSAGVKVCYVEPAAEEPPRSLRGIAGRHEVDIDGALRRGQLQVLSADALTFTSTCLTDAVEQALAVGYSGVRWAWEATTSIGMLSAAGHLQREQVIEEWCHTRPVSVLCQYPTEVTSRLLQNVCGMHGHGVRHRRLHTSDVPGGVAVAGEVDVGTQRLLRTALAAASARERGHDFIVELSGLVSLDVVGARAFVTGTSGHRMRGGVVRFRGAQPRAERLLRLLGVGRDQSFILEPGCDG